MLVLNNLCSLISFAQCCDWSVQKLQQLDRSVGDAIEKVEALVDETEANATNSKETINELITSLMVRLLMDFLLFSNISECLQSSEEQSTKYNTHYTVSRENKTRVLTFRSAADATLAIGLVTVLWAFSALALCTEIISHSLLFLVHFYFVLARSNFANARRRFWRWWKSKIPVLPTCNSSLCSGRQFSCTKYIVLF